MQLLLLRQQRRRRRRRHLAGISRGRRCHHHRRRRGRINAVFVDAAFVVVVVFGIGQNVVDLASSVVFGIVVVVVGLANDQRRRGVDHAHVLGGGVDRTRARLLRPTRQFYARVGDGNINKLLQVINTFYTK